MKQQYRVIIRTEGEPDYEELYEDELRQLADRQVFRVSSGMVAVVEIESHPVAGKPGIVIARRVKQVHG